MVPFSSPTSSTSAKSSQWSMMICCNGDAFGRGMARADMDTGNQLFVAPSRTARASSSHSWSKRSRCGCLPRQPGRFSLPALPKACARLFAASHLSHLTHRFSVWREAPLSKKRRVPRQVLGPLCTNQCQGSRPDVRSGRPAAYEQGRRQHLWVGVYRPTPGNQHVRNESTLGDRGSLSARTGHCRKAPATRTSRSAASAGRDELVRRPWLRRRAGRRFRSC